MLLSRPSEFLFLIAGPMLLAGCATVPDLEQSPDLRTPSTVASERSVTGDAAAWPEAKWWAAYGDPQLNALIEEGLANSPDVSGAAARLLRAQGLAQQAGASLAPSVTLAGDATFDKQSYVNGFPKEFVPKGWKNRGAIGAQVGFDLDLWGKNRSALAAAMLQSEAAALDARQARLILATGIADAYADLAVLYAEHEIRTRSRDLLRETEALVRDRVAIGLDTRGDLRQAEANRMTAQADLAGVEETIALRQHQIAALVGAGPDRSLSITPPALPQHAVHGLPGDVTTALIARRPDIAVARARAEAAMSRIKVARADFYPAIRLEGLIGVQSLGLGQLIGSDAIYGSAGPAISLPIFDGGAIAGRYRVSRADYDEAVANYNAAVLNAYREVADVATSRRALDERLSNSRAALAASEDAYRIARLRYVGGLSGYLDLLLVEERLLAARRSAALLDMQAFQLDVALIRALGGGFAEERAASETISKDNDHG